MSDVNNEERFLSYLRVERGLASNTLSAYRNDLAKLSLFAQTRDKDVLSLQPGDLAAFVQSLHKRGLGPKSVARALVAVRGFYKFLIQDGHLKLDPSVNLEAPKSWQSLPRFLASHEVERLSLLSGRIHRGRLARQGDVGSPLRYRHSSLGTDRFGTRQPES